MKTALENMAAVVETLMQNQADSMTQFLTINQRMDSLAALLRTTVRVMKDETPLRDEHLGRLIDALDAFTEMGKVVKQELVRQESRDERTEHMLALLAESVRECRGE